MSKTKLNIPMLAALILLLLTMVTTHYTSGLYARYSSTAYGEDTARVAAFDVSFDLTNNENDTYTITVSNDSEVSVKYSIIVEMDKHLSVAIGDDVKTIEGSETFVTFENTSWTLAPETKAEPLTLKFAVADWSGLTDPDQYEGSSTEVKLGFKVRVAAEQID